MAHPEDVQTTSESHLNQEESDSTSFTKEPFARRSGFVDVTGLIRSIQRVEGNSDCFRRGQPGCPEVECCWRPYCLEGKPI